MKNTHTTAVRTCIYLLVIEVTAGRSPSAHMKTVVKVNTQHNFIRTTYRVRRRFIDKIDERLCCCVGDVREVEIVQSGCYRQYVLVKRKKSSCAAAGAAEEVLSCVFCRSEYRRVDIHTYVKYPPSLLHLHPGRANIPKQ